MNRVIRLLILSLACVTLARAEDKAAKTDTAKYLEALQLKLDHAARRVNQPTTTGSPVVGLRGSKAEPMSKQLYWKGRSKPQPVTPEEVRLFRAAVSQAREGQTAQAVTALQDFTRQYPASALRPDVEETLKRLGSAPAVETSTAPAHS